MIDKEFPLCPLCGSNADYFYLLDGKVIGCSDCVKAVDYMIIRKEADSWSDFLKGQECPENEDQELAEFGNRPGLFKETSRDDWEDMLLSSQ